MPKSERSKVIFDATSLRYVHTGLGQFSHQLLTEMARTQPAGLDISALVNPNYASLVPANLAVERATWLRRHSPQTIQKKLFSCRLWHMTTENTRITGVPDSAKLLLTIHGLHILDETNEKTSEHLVKMQGLVNRADRISAVSAYTADLAAKKLDLKGKPVTVIHNGVSFSDIPGSTPAWAPPGKFIFSIGTFFKRKNFQVLIPMMHHLPDHYLVLAGDFNLAHGDFIKEEVEKQNLKERVILPGEITESEKAWLYHAGEALMLPSLSEGFGIPVIEAFHFGKPVVCSANGSLPEVGRDFAAYWKHFDPVYMAARVREELEGDTAEKKAARKNYADKFSWAATAGRFVNLYREMLG